jgi:type VI secretion system (T6SS) effector Hcp
MAAASEGAVTEPHHLNITYRSEIMSLRRLTRAMMPLLSFGFGATLTCFIGFALAAQLPTAFIDSAGARTPGSDFANPASIIITDTSGAPAITSPIFAVQAEFTTPTDPATGLPTGRSTFNGFTVTRDIGANSGRLFANMMTNRILTTVVLTFSTIPAVTITVTNARINSYRTLMSQRPGGSYAEIEEIGFSFSGSYTVSDGAASGVFDRAAF